MIRTFDHAEVEELAKYAYRARHQRPDRPPPPLPDPRRRAHDAGAPRRLSRGSGWRGSATATTWPTRGSTPRRCSASSSGSRARRATSPTARSTSAPRSSTKTLITEEPEEAAAGADVVTTDVWASMGQEGEAEERKQRLPGLRGGRGADEAGQAVRHLPALPARAPRGGGHGRVIEGPQSRVFDEAENRLHAQKALIATLLG